MSNLMMFTLLVLFGFCSCEKEEVKISKTSTIEINPSAAKDDGDDDDDPIIQGRVLEDNQLVDSVVTEIYSTSTRTLVRETGNNGFNLQVPVGTYFFKITQEGESLIETDDFQVLDDIDITIYLDSI